MLEGLFTTITNVNFNEETLRQQIENVHRAKQLLLAQRNDNSTAGESGNTSSSFAADISDSNEEVSDYDMQNLWNADEDIRSLKSLILFGLRGMAAYAYHAMVLGYTDEVVNAFFYEGLAAVGENHTMEQLLPLVLKVGEVNLKCMALLDQANTETYGDPVPTTVPLTGKKDRSSSSPATI